MMKSLYFCTLFVFLTPLFSWAGELARPTTGGSVATQSARCEKRPLEAQFIGVISSVPAGVNPLQTQSGKGILCRFRMAKLDQFSPAVGSCPFYDRERLTDSDLDVWLPKDEGCPEKGDSFSGVAQVGPDGKLEFDANVSRNGRCSGKLREAQFIGKVSSGSETENPVRTVPSEALICTFQMGSLAHFAPANGACPFNDEQRITRHNLEIKVAKSIGCPKAGDDYSGVVQLKPDGKLNFDATTAKPSK